MHFGCWNRSLSCRTIGMPIVAEGVEDEAAVANLSDMGVDLAQGYFFFRPLPRVKLKRASWRGYLISERRVRTHAGITTITTM